MNHSGNLLISFSPHEVQYYDFNDWTRLIRTPFEIYWDKIIINNGIVYGFVTGFDGLVKLWKWNPMLDDQFQLVGCLGEDAIAQVCMFNSSIYVTIPYSQLIKIYDISRVIDGQLKCSALIDVHSDSTICIFNGTLYCSGGWRNQNVLSVYEHELETWKSLSELPTGLYGHAFCQVNSYLYAIGGRTGQNQPSALVQQYDIAKDVWTQVTPLLKPIAKPVVSCLDGLILAHDDDNPTNTEIQVYDFNHDSWQFMDCTVERGEIILCYYVRPARPIGLRPNIFR